MGTLAEIKDSVTRTPGRIAIILTSFPYLQYRQTYLAAGADYFFDKTQDIQKMTDLLDGLAAKNGGSLID